APARHQLVHRSQQIVRVDDEHRRAILHERPRGDVLDLPELRVERLHDQLALAQKAIHDQAVGVVVVPHDNDGQIVTGGRWRVRGEYLTRGDEADASAV